MNTCSPWWLCCSVPADHSPSRRADQRLLPRQEEDVVGAAELCAITEPAANLQESIPDQGKRCADGEELVVLTYGIGPFRARQGPLEPPGPFAGRPASTARARSLAALRRSPESRRLVVRIVVPYNLVREQSQGQLGCRGQ